MGEQVEILDFEESNIIGSLSALVAHMEDTGKVLIGLWNCEPANGHNEGRIQAVFTTEYDDEASTHATTGPAGAHDVPREVEAPFKTQHEER